MSFAITSVTGLLDHPAIKTLLYSAAASLGITSGVYLAIAPDASIRDKRIGWTTVAFSSLLALYALAVLFAWFRTTGAYSSYMPTGLY